MTETLRSRLLGAWRLLDAVAEPADGSSPQRPHGEHPVGLILYTPDGHMAVQIMAAERAIPASVDWTALTSEEYAAEARSYFAYAGTFEVDEAAGTVMHHMAMALFPRWVGDGQVRVVELDGDRLVLRSTAPVMTGGRLATIRISWERARS
jgi:hypothetical protein